MDIVVIIIASNVKKYIVIISNNIQNTSYNYQDKHIHHEYHHHLFLLYVSNIPLNIIGDAENT